MASKASRRSPSFRTPVGQAFEFPGLDLGAVLLLAEVFHLGRNLVDAAVEALDLGVQAY